MYDPVNYWNREEVCGWTVAWQAPILMILDHHGRVVYYSNEWDPNMADPREDALAWASAIADPGSGMTIDESVERVRELAPAGFADECAMLALEVTA